MTKLEFISLFAIAQLRAFAMTGKKTFNFNTDLIFAQAKLESGNFGSKIFRENNNIFGLKHPRIRLSTSVGERNGHAVYKNLLECCTDYVLRQINFKVKDTGEVDTYLAELLRTGYAEDPNYLQKIKALYNQGLRDG